MATVTIDGPNLLVKLTMAEKMGSFHGNVQVPVSSVRAASVEATPWNAIRGTKAAGVGIPGGAALGVRYFSGGKDFTAVHGDQPAVRIDLDDKAPYSRLVLSVADPDKTVAAILAAAGT